MLRRTLIRPLTAFCFARQSKNSVDKSEMLVNAFTDQAISNKQEQTITSGRSWKAAELRLKSTDDLHKLWFVCVREKNLVLADEMAKNHNPSYQRKAGKIRRVEKLDQTMSRILHVINEREKVRKEFRSYLEDLYIQKKRKELKAKVKEEP